MSFLPYGERGPLSLLVAGGGSMALHGAAMAALVLTAKELVPVPLPEEPGTELVISLEQLDASALDSLIGREPAEETTDAPLVPLAADEVEQAEAEPEVAEADQVEAIEAPEPPEAEPEVYEPEVAEATADVLLQEAEALEPLVEETPAAAEDLALLVSSETLLADETGAALVVADPLPLADQSIEQPVPDALPDAPLPMDDTPQVVLPEDDGLQLMEEEDSTQFADGSGGSGLLSLADPVPQEPDAAVPLEPLPDEQLAALVPLPDPIPDAAPLPSAPQVQPAPEDGFVMVPDVTAPFAIPPATPAPEAQAPIQPDGPAVAKAEPLAPDVAVTGEPVAQAPTLDPRDARLVALIERVRTVPGDSCLVALPRRVGANGTGLALFSAEDGAMLDFAAALLTEDGDDDIQQTRTLVDERQCAALSFLNQAPEYPATRIGMRLDAGGVISGDRLTGMVSGLSGSFMLLLVDINGVVQDVTRFVARSGSLARFEIPMTRVGPGREAAQLLVALTAEGDLSALEPRMGQLAVDVFNDLPQGIADSASPAVVGFRMN